MVPLPPPGLRQAGGKAWEEGKREKTDKRRRFDRRPWLPITGQEE
jgi:hypothetical protein